MKKTNQKNCIAFTLMEMTLVLLITSIIAAASTPIVTSAVSDYAERAYAPTEGESADAPWRNASGYNGGGIFNPPIQATSPIGINSKFGSTASSYKYPALAIEARGGNLISNPQIQIRPLVPSAPVYPSSNISMDAYENIAFTAGMASFSEGKVSGAVNNYIGARNIFMGADIQGYSSYSYSDMYYNNSIFMGSGISTRMSDNVINIGFRNFKHSHERNTINIGALLGSEYSNNTYQGSVIIGNYSNLTSVRDVITIGNYAASSSAFMNDILIGKHAGMNSGTNTIDDSSNIIIGAYASKCSASYAGAVANGNEKSIFIGNKAGFISSDGTRGLSRSFDIAMGYYASNKSLSPSGRDISINSIAIGKYADYMQLATSFRTKNNIKIGLYSGMNTAKYSNNIFVGSFAGAGATADNIIAIGSSESETATTGKNSVSGLFIGRYAGNTSKAQYGSVYIGSYAGYNSPSLVYRYGNVGIGPYACGSYMSQARNKWCLGWGGYSSAISTYWTPTDDTPQMFIGYALAPVNTYSNTSIIFYANDVYKPTSTSFNTFSVASDRRLKTNIVPLRDNSLEKIRKVNIYDYTLKDDEHKVPQIGVVAQEHKKVFPQDVRIEPMSKLYAVGLDWLIFTMLDAIKDIDKNVQNLQNKTNTYIKDFMGLKSKVAKLEAQSKALNSQNKVLKSRLAKINAKLK